MRCSLEFRGLSAIGLCAAFATCSSGAFAQGSSVGSPIDASPEPVVAEMNRSGSVGLESRPTPEEQGDALMLRHRYQAAIEAYQQAPQDSPVVWNKLGIAHQMMFNLQEASRCYRMSLSLNQNNPHVFNNLGTIYESQKRYGDAERMYRRAILLNPGSAPAYRNLGTVLLAQHNYKKGWDAYQAALSLDPQIFLDRASPKTDDPGSPQDRGAMNYYMARGCVRAGMNDCAIDYLRRALNEGFTDEKKIQDDSEFAGLRGIPAFQQLLAEQKQQ